MLGLAAARENGPFVATLSIDARTRGARRIHTPFLALLQEERLGIGLLARDADGVTRRFSAALPTEDGAFPTFAGRLCRALERGCGDGLIHYALGKPFAYVPMHQVLETTDPAWLERAFGLGERVAIQTGTVTVEGTFDTLDEVGCLIVRTADGKRVPITAGEVYFGSAASVRVS